MTRTDCLHPNGAAEEAQTLAFSMCVRPGGRTVRQSDSRVVGKLGSRELLQPCPKFDNLGLLNFGSHEPLGHGPQESRHPSNGPALARRGAATCPYRPRIDSRSSPSAGRTRAEASNQAEHTQWHSIRKHHGGQLNRSGIDTSLFTALYAICLRTRSRRGRSTAPSAELVFDLLSPELSPNGKQREEKPSKAISRYAPVFLNFVFSACPLFPPLSGYEPEGREFESIRAHQKSSINTRLRRWSGP